MSNYIENRPWGSFENLLDTDYCKVKRIIVKPGQRLSYQYHHKRTEYWVVVQGKATVTLDHQVGVFDEGEVVIIPVGTKHRVENKDKEDLIELLDLSNNNFLNTKVDSWQKVLPLYPISPIN